LNRPLKLYSHTLGASIWLAPVAAAGLDAPVYTHAECRVLVALAPTPEQLRAIHLAKTELDGDLTESLDPASLRRRYNALLDQYNHLVQHFDTQPPEEATAALRQLAHQLSHLLCLGEKIR
ncbi:MAG: hypothetical protein AAF413_03775, partial [Patescibacteria group bacterium]